MSFLQGSFSAQRFKADSPSFLPGAVDRLLAHNFNRAVAGEDGVLAGWGGGDHKYDAEITPEKNLRGDFLHWAFRVTKFAPPADEVKAQFMIELKGLMDAAGVQVPTAKMKREAREAAQSVIEEKGKDGRWDKHTLTPVVWDGKTGQVWLGTASHSNAGRFMDLFRLTFGVEIVPITPGMILAQTDPDGEDKAPDPAFGNPAWCPDGLDWLGNEFALWVIWNGNMESDGGGVDTPCVTNKVVLACPDGMYGTDTFAHVFPASLPEFRKALSDGRLPRTTGLTLTGRGENTTLTLDPEAWVVSGAKVPELEDVPPGVERETQRLEQCRDLFTRLDDVYGQFLDTRLGDGWAEVAGRINQWTGRVPAEVG